MHVLVLSTSSFDKNYSSYHLMEDIIKSLLDAGHKVSLVQYAFVDDSKPPESLSRYDSFSCHSIRMDYEKTDGFVNRYVKELKYLREAGDIISCIDNHLAIDVAFVQSNNSLWAATKAIKKSSRAKILYNEQDLFPDNALYAGLIPKGLPYSILKRLLKRGYKDCSKIVTISHDMKDSICEYFDTEPVPVDVVYNWHQKLPDHFCSLKNPLKEKLPTSEQDVFRVVYAGTIGKMQAVDVLIEAANILRNREDIHFYIVGSGSSKQSIDQLVREGDLINVHVCDCVEAELAPYLYSLASVNYIPLVDHGIRTCLPSKTAICLASGRPLIAQIDKESSFSAELQSYEGVFVVNPGNAAELADAIVKVFEKYGTEGSPIEFSWPQGSGDDYCRIIEQFQDWQ